MTDFLTAPGSVTKERYLLQKKQPNGTLKFLEDAPSLEEIKNLRDWWVSDAANPEAYRKRLRIVKETTVTTYEDVEA